MDSQTLNKINHLTEQAISGSDTSAADGLWLLELDLSYLLQIMAGADRIRQHFRGEQIEICAISNVRSGNCAENCHFCPQSAHFKTEAPKYDYIDQEELLAQAKKAREWGASDFGIVSKGWGVRGEREATQLKAYFSTLKDNSDIGRCASIGVLDDDTAVMLKEAGMENYHHNLETAESFFDNICTTHSYQENIDTVKSALDAGLRVCSGGILGMGESMAQRIELATTLRDLGVKSVPLNFLTPQAGTPFADITPMAPREILQNIAVFRFMLPSAEIRIAGGRPFLRDLQSMIFMAGASGIMIGDYLTTAGRSVEDDLQMLKDLGVTAREDTQTRRAAQHLETNQTNQENPADKKDLANQDLASQDLARQTCA